MYANDGTVSFVTPVSQILYFSRTNVLSTFWFCVRQRDEWLAATEAWTRDWARNLVNAGTIIDYRLNQASFQQELGFQVEHALRIARSPPDVETKNRKVLGRCSCHSFVSRKSPPGRVK